MTTTAMHPKGTLAATILGSSLAFIDGSVVNVALPAIEHDLASSGASGASIGWLIQPVEAAFGARFPGFVAERLNEWVGIAKLFRPHSRRL